MKSLSMYIPENVEDLEELVDSTIKMTYDIKKGVSYLGVDKKLSKKDKQQINKNLKETIKILKKVK
ncbi:MAG: hypothetical protein ACOCT9_01550 [archaeon]